MRSICRILVAIKDPSSRAFPAVEKAAQLAKAFGAELELFHALTATVYADIYGFSARRASAIERELRARSLEQLESMAKDLLELYARRRVATVYVLELRRQRQRPLPDAAGAGS